LRFDLIGFEYHQALSRLDGASFFHQDLQHATAQFRPHLNLLGLDITAESMFCRLRPIHDEPGANATY
jgi:hypothetical protein